MEANQSFLKLLILFSIFTISRSVSLSPHYLHTRQDEADCNYTLYVKTSKTINGGTDSKISITFYDAACSPFHIDDIEAWGRPMGSKYNYFERGNLDSFSGSGTCLTGPICTMKLTSDGTGSGHGWFCNYVEVLYTGDHLSYRNKFKVEQWLPTSAWPYELSTVKELRSGSSCRAKRMNCGRDSSRMLVK